MMLYYPDRYFAHRISAYSRYERMMDYVGPAAGSLLDVGTATGGFLSAAIAAGWDAHGIEPSADATARAIADGLDVVHGRFPEDCRFDDATFDLITAWAVFEHLSDPAAAFAACYRLLRPGGRLLLQVPNLRSIQSRWARQEDIPRHLFFFTERTLGGYARRSGLMLDHVIHTTDLFGGSGRGVLRLLLLRLLGHPVETYFRMYTVPRRERFERWPVLASFCSLIGLVEKVMLNDWLVRAMRISGQVVASLSKPIETYETQALSRTAT